MRIGLIEARDSVARAIVEMAALHMGEEIRFLMSEADLQRPWEGTQTSPGPDILLLGLDQYAAMAFAGARAVRAWAPDCAIVAYGADLPADVRTAAIGLGARLILRAPFTANDLAGAIALAPPRAPMRALPPAGDFFTDDLLASAALTAHDDPARILSDAASTRPLVATGAPPLTPRPLGAASAVTVFGAKGGVGASVLAVNLACALSSLGRRVCLIDANAGFGSCGALLGFSSTAPSMLDVVEGELSVARVRSALVEHRSGLYALLAPPSPESAPLITADFVRTVVGLLRGEFDVLVIDCRTNYGEREIALLRAADRIVIACSPEYTALRCMQAFMATVLGRLAYPRERLLPVLIRANTMSRSSQAGAEALLTLPFLWRIVSDGPRVKRSVDAGHPVILSDPDAQVSRDIWALALFLAGKDEIPGRTGLLGALAALRARRAHASARPRIFLHDAM